jgi:hypothetical protein
MPKGLYLKKKIMTSKQPSVCSCATKYLKETRYLLMKWKLCEEKNNSGETKPRKSTIQKQS